MSALHKALFCFVGVLGLALGIALAGPARAATPGSRPATAPAFEKLTATDTDAIIAAAKRGAEAEITGVVASVTVAKSGKVARVAFEGVTRDDGFAASVFPATFADMKATFGGEAGAGLKGRKIRLKGALDMYQDAPQIVIKNVNQIEILK